MIPEFKLHNGVCLPAIGLGTYLAEDGNEAYRCVLDALDLGYRSIDTAMFYYNEVSIGKAIRESSVPREEIFVTTKLWNDSHGYEKTLKAFDASLKRLGLDYIDEYLIHWPLLEKEYRYTWKAMEKLYSQGLIRIIGVSNFLKVTLTDLLHHCDVKPMINQLEVNPQFQPNDLIAFCQQNDVLVEAWRPLIWGKLDREPISTIAKAHGKTPVQVTLRWLYQRGVRTLPKTTHKARMAENMDIFDFTLNDNEIAGINALNTWVRTGESPDEFVFKGEQLLEKHRAMGYPC